MGQAKNRGTFEQRQALALVRMEAEDLARKVQADIERKAELERRAAMTDEEREAEREKARIERDLNMKLALMMAPFFREPPRRRVR